MRILMRINFYLFQMSASFVSKYIHITNSNIKVTLVARQHIFSARPKCFDLNCFLSMVFSISVVVCCTFTGYFSFSFANVTNSSISFGIFDYMMFCNPIYLIRWIIFWNPSKYKYDHVSFICLSIICCWKEDILRYFVLLYIPTCHSGKSSLWINTLSCFMNKNGTIWFYSVS